jgi:hypothetical protein
MRYFSTFPFSHLPQETDQISSGFYSNSKAILQSSARHHLSKLGWLDKFSPIMEIRRCATGPVPLLKHFDHAQPASPSAIDRQKQPEMFSASL